MRIGHGYDAHRFCPDKPLVIGGVTIPYELGMLAHSDGDVLMTLWTVRNRTLHPSS